MVHSIKNTKFNLHVLRPLYLSVFIFFYLWAFLFGVLSFNFRQFLDKKGPGCLHVRVICFCRGGPQVVCRESVEAELYFTIEATSVPRPKQDLDERVVAESSHPPEHDHPPSVQVLVLVPEGLHYKQH